MDAPAHTRTGGFPIGVRRGWGAWQRDLGGWLSWVKSARLAHVDLGNDGDRLLGDVQAAGVAVGSVDLPRWKELLSPDAGKRREAVAVAASYVERCAAAGVTRFLTILLPEDPARPRKDNFAAMLESYAALVPVLERAGAAIAIEGWPGPGALGCTPETLRALFRELPSPSIGINFDPSHLVRMRIDPLRFIDEFATRIRHAHAKDAIVSADQTYEFGTEQEAMFATAPRFGGPTWRYTIPGRGDVPWPEAFARLNASGYHGPISIELEDADFNGTDAGEQRGIVLACDFLGTC